MWSALARGSARGSIEALENKKWRLVTNTLASLRRTAHLPRSSISLRMQVPNQEALLLRSGHRPASCSCNQKGQCSSSRNSLLPRGVIQVAVVGGSLKLQRFWGKACRRCEAGSTILTQRRVRSLWWTLLAIFWILPPRTKKSTIGITFKIQYTHMSHSLNS